MRAWVSLCVLLLLSASEAQAQQLPRSRFHREAALAPPGRDAQGESLLQPRLCERSKGHAAVRGAMLGILIGGAISIVVTSYYVVKAATSMRAQPEFPVAAVTVGTMALGAVLESVEWERQCG